MKKAMIMASLCTLIAGGSPAQQAHSFKNPCERGPIPKLAIINGANAEFVDFLMRIRPSMSQATAQHIAYRLCDDLAVVGDSQGLTQRLNLLLQKY